MNFLEYFLKIFWIFFENFLKNFLKKCSPPRKKILATPMPLLNAKSHLGKTIVDKCSPLSISFITQIYLKAEIYSGPFKILSIICPVGEDNAKIRKTPLRALYFLKDVERFYQIYWKIGNWKILTLTNLIDLIHQPSGIK